jgi:hypothetical protein
VKVIGVPLQVAATGVIVTVETTGSDVALTALNEAMFPVPFAPNPIDEFEFVQL